MAKNKRLRGKMDKPASPAVVLQRSREQLYTEGKAIRDCCPRLSHANWKPPANRADPIEILEASGNRCPTSATSYWIDTRGKTWP